LEILPLDQHNQVLIQNVHPRGWVNPEPSGAYNLVVIGGGTAGLVTAAIASAIGARVALIERGLMGGDCLNTGCVPSKAILRVSRVLGEIGNAPVLGINFSGKTEVDFKRVMERMRELRARISANDSVRRFQKMGVDIFLGEGKFLDSRSVEVSGKTLKFSKAAICTGARPAIPGISGLKDKEVLTSETIFSLTELPSSLAVIGAGPVGSEMAQAFNRFGSRVSLFDEASRILPREEEEAAKILEKKMRKEGIHLFLGSKILRVETRGKEKVIYYETGGGKKEESVQKILLSTGRVPNVEALGLENAGVAYDLKRGIRVDSTLQSTNPRVYAAGDASFPYQFTHTAEATAQILIQNALFPHPFGLGSARIDDLIIPRCTYTDPEIAHVGRFDEDILKKRGEVESLTFPLSEVDRAILDGTEEGFIRVHLKKGSDKLVGATLVAPHAGEMISELTVAMKSGAGLGLISRTIHPYPTMAEVIKKVATAWRKKTLTENKKNLLKNWFSFFR
jgi:pyruvate/2-oxoglutarate dehydrogenase complex dihydrolipoamide dehydrogenase (E3) component